MTAEKHILHIFPSFGIGGMEVLTCKLINHFKEQFHHSIISLDNNYAAKKLVDPNIEVHYVENSDNHSNTVLNILQFRKVISAIKPDLLSTYNWGSLNWVIARFFITGLPHIHSEHGFGPDETNHQLWRRSITRKLFLSHSSKIIVPSITLKTIASTIWHLPAESIQYIPNGIHCDTVPKKRVLSRSGKIILGSLGSLSKVKNVLRLLKTFHNLPNKDNFLLKIAGDGREKNNIEHYINSNNLNSHIQLSGHVSNPAEFMKNIDIFCMTSDSEQMPMALLEAMSAGCPCICTDVGDIKHMLSDANSRFVFHVDDRQGFLNAIQQLSGNASLRSEMGIKNYKKCKETFSESKMFNAYGSLYNDLMNTSK